MTGKMKAAVLTALKTISIQEREIPLPDAGEVLIKVKHAGICGSDLHYYEHGRIGTQEVSTPWSWGMRLAVKLLKLAVQ